MKKNNLLFLVLIIICIYVQPSFAQQSDTSSYFPIGLWGNWINPDKPPFTGDLTQLEWDKEFSNWGDINGNYLVYWIPYWVQDTVLAYADANGYKMDIANFNYWSNSHPPIDNLRDWLYTPNSTTQELIDIINDIKSNYGSHQGFFNYMFGEEDPVSNPDLWPRVELISQKISEIDPERKSYMVAGGAPLEAFFDATPHLAYSSNGLLFVLGNCGNEIQRSTSSIRCLFSSVQ